MVTYHGAPRPSLRCRGRSRALPPTVPLRFKNPSCRPKKSRTEVREQVPSKEAVAKMLSAELGLRHLPGHLGAERA